MVQISVGMRHGLSIVQIPKVGQNRQGFHRPQRKMMEKGVGSDKWPHAIADYEIWKGRSLVPRREELRTNGSCLSLEDQRMQYFRPPAGFEAVFYTRRKQRRWVGIVRPRGTPHTGGGGRLFGGEWMRWPRIPRDNRAITMRIQWR
jgi:hypothetical protein